MYSCTRTSFTVTTDAGSTNLWSALMNDVLLQADCRTLNEAKNVCRAAARVDFARDLKLPQNTPASVAERDGAFARVASPILGARPTSSLNAHPSPL